MSAALAFVSERESELGFEQLAAYVGDEETRAVVQAATSSRWPTATIHDGGLAIALGNVSQEPSPGLMIVDIGASDEPTGAIRSLMTLIDPMTRVIAIGSINDVTIYRDLIAAGATDYLVKPVSPEDLEAALVGAKRATAETHGETKRLRTIAVIGARDGVGATTVAVNTAWIIAHELGKTVALIDLDLQFGTVALALDLEPSHGLREALEKPDRIDGLFIASAMAHESEHLFVLSAEEPVEDQINVNPHAFDLLVDTLPDDFDCVVIDLPPRLVSSQLQLLQNIDTVALVSDLSIPGMRDTARLSHMIRSAAPETALMVIANKVGATKSGELPKAEFTRGAELPINFFLPNDPKIAAEASNAGKPFPVVGKRSPIVKTLRSAALTMSGDRPIGQRAGMLGKLFARGSKS
jgi:pilus assembly protein CpaE